MKQYFATVFHICISIDFTQSESYICLNPALASALDDVEIITEKSIFDYSKKISSFLSTDPDCRYLWTSKEKKPLTMNLKVSSWFSGLWHNLRKLLIVLYWKNFTLKCRHYVMSTLEIVVPTLLFVAVLAIFQWGGDNLTPSYKNETLTEMSTLPQEYCME